MEYHPKRDEVTHRVTELKLSADSFAEEVMLQLLVEFIEGNLKSRIEITRDGKPPVAFCPLEEEEK